MVAAARLDVDRDEVSGGQRRSFGEQQCRASPRSVALAVGHEQRGPPGGLGP